MRCPICHHEARREGNPYRPFCSERCKLIDLDNWLSGRYRVPGPPVTEETSEEPVLEEFDDQGGRKGNSEAALRRSETITRKAALNQSHDHD